MYSAALNRHDANPELECRRPLLRRLLDVFDGARDHRRPGAELAQRLPLHGVALDVGRRDAVAERPGWIVLRDHPGRGPEEVGRLAWRMAAIARRQLAAVSELDLDRLDPRRVERLALQIAHADAEHDVLAALELAGEHADRAGRAERRVAAHDVALDEQLLDLLRLRATAAHDRGEASGGDDLHGWHRTTSLAINVDGVHSLRLLEIAQIRRRLVL